MKIKLPIFYNNDTTFLISENGIDVELEECDVREMTFYSIANIGPYSSTQENYTSLHSGGSSFICTLPPELVESMIDKARANQ